MSGKLDKKKIEGSKIHSGSTGAVATKMKSKDPSPADLSTRGKHDRQKNAEENSSVKSLPDTNNHKPLSSIAPKSNTGAAPTTTSKDALARPKSTKKEISSSDHTLLPHISSSQKVNETLTGKVNDQSLVDKIKSTRKKRATTSIDSASHTEQAHTNHLLSMSPENSITKSVSPAPSFSAQLAQKPQLSSISREASVSKSASVSPASSFSGKQVQKNQPLPASNEIPVKKSGSFTPATSFSSRPARKDQTLSFSSESVTKSATVSPATSFSAKLAQPNPSTMSPEISITNSACASPSLVGRARSFPKSNLADSIRKFGSESQEFGSSSEQLDGSQSFRRAKSYRKANLGNELKLTLLDPENQVVSTIDISEAGISSEDINRSRSLKKSSIADLIKATRSASSDSLHSTPSSLDPLGKKKGEGSLNANPENVSIQNHLSVVQADQPGLDVGNGSASRKTSDTGRRKSYRKSVLVEQIKKHQAEVSFSTEHPDYSGKEKGDNVKTKETRSTRSRHYDATWTLVACYVKLGRNLVNRFKKCAQWADNLVKLPLKDDGNMAFIMKMYKSEADSNLSKKMSILLARNSTRSRDSINDLDQILKYRLPSYAAFPLEKRMKICKIMQYESYPEGKLVCREGQRAENFYFILSGKIEITLIKETSRTRVNIMNMGESIGRIQLVNDIRMASIATMMPTELLCVNKREFASVLHQLMSPAELKEQIDALRVLPHFGHHKDFLERSKGCFEISVYSTGDVVMVEGDLNDRIYFIIQGMCRCTKSVPFISKKNTTTKDLALYDSSKTLLPNEEVVHFSLDIQDLETSDHFPGIPPDSNKIKEILAVNSDKAISMLRGYVGNENNDVNVSLAQFSVIATSRSEIASISKIDYVTFATPDMLTETIMQKNMYSVSIKEVQDAFLAHQEWKSYKKNVVSNGW